MFPIVELRRAWWAALAPLVVALSSCSEPCEANEDCGATAFCAEGFCRSDCAGDADCAATHRCERGKCNIGLTPTLRILSPEDGALVEGPFTMEVETEFRGVSAVATLLPEAGEGCVPAFAQTEIVQGGDGPNLVRFEGVVPRGERFAYRVRVETELSSAEAARAFRGQGSLEVPADALVTAPAAIVDGEAAAVAVSVRYAQVQPQIIAFTEPERGPQSVRRLVGSNLSELEEVRVPLARGRQILWLETPLGEVVQRCGIAVDATGGEVDETEFALSFEDPAGADLDVVIVAELDSGELFSCSAKRPLGCGATEDPGFREAADESVFAPRAPGVYGVAVVPAAIAGEPQAWVRVTDAGGHVDFLGPRRVLASQGETWLAARVWVSADDVFIEPLDLGVEELPSQPPTAW